MFTPEKIAEVCHEANRVLQKHLGDPMNLEWDALDGETKQSATQGVMAAQDGKTPEELHEDWMIFKKQHGWVFGDVKNVEKKTHPCLVAYSELPDEQKVKDFLFYHIVQALTLE